MATAIALPRQPHSNWLARLRTIGLGIGARGAVGVGLARQRGGAAAPWWLAGGAPAPIAVYQPKGAASLAASYVNLANPGTYDAAPGVAPAWSEETGWTFNGSTQVLKSGVLDLVSLSLIVRIDAGIGVSTTVRTVIGSSYCKIAPHGGSSTYGNYVIYQHGNTALLRAPVATAGVLCMTPAVAYRNGTSEGNIPSVSMLGRMILIGAQGENASGSNVVSFWQGNVFSLAIYNATLSAAQVAAISAAMAAP